eukprot:CAMPEP_0201872936 /NCGR_PEP_ID=MMETSP0902-20130614/5547_1 /ASSEMBLY_ACC=CAM_ASM_000551 /TAXON_ID=420261 /ORGANISM="Thalassiosira antarctica, Strain CCMP982" /LENGTH=532 /DNA_ID=CAMNT_0048399377 /DNA_START=25 /DNA_END=1626 /DNA_ORIENTATION=-
MTDCCLASTAATKATRSFWLLGMLNNAPWVLMLAVATNISAGGVALVFLSNMIPGLIVKITAPYWFHLISYKVRMLMACVAMGLACFLVGCGGLFRDGGDIHDQESNDADRQRRGLALELLGVSFVSFSCSLGEASLLALAGKFDSIILPRLYSPDSYRVISEEHTEDTANKISQQNDAENLFTNSEENVGKLMKQEDIQQRRSITAFSSGTGLAGIVGYGYKALFSELFGWGLSATVWSAMLFPLAYWFIYIKGLHSLELSMQQDASAQSEIGSGESIHSSVTSESSLLVKNENGGSDNSSIQDYRQSNNREGASPELEMVHTETIHANTMLRLETTSQTDTTDASRSLTAFERFQLVLSLWPYMTPLFTVYAAEYMIQAGVWSAIGFPVTSASARAQFYQYSNWTYQAGVFLSRSSGNLWTASIPILWLMPFLQVVNLYFFWMISIHHFWYNYGLLLPCFFAGLLGGGVYVQGFSRVNMDMPMDLREIAIASVGVADASGALVADILSLFIQSCIYKQNHLEGAVVDCPY